MNRMAIVGMTAALGGALLLGGCSTGGATAGGSGDSAGGTAHQTVEVKQSPDKYTWYVKDYIGKNAASIGYTALDGMRRDSYGSGLLKVVYVTPDGMHIDLDEESEELQDYVVVDQNLEPNTEIKYTFQLDENGEEYDNLVDSQNYDEIVLAVTKVGEQGSYKGELTSIDSSPDKYTRKVKDYVGRNLADCGYIALSGDLNDHYGNGFLTLVVTAEDGSFVDVSDETVLPQYVVTSQDVAPNVDVSMTFSKNADGVEYSNLVESKSLETINLTVRKLEAEQ